jgi:hypothetical protein
MTPTPASICGNYKNFANFTNVVVPLKMSRQLRTLLRRPVSEDFPADYAIGADSPSFGLG